MFPDPKPVNGKRFVPTLLVGFVVFTLVGLGGTYYVSEFMTPYLRKSADAARAKLEAKERARDAQLSTTTKP